MFKVQYTAVCSDRVDLSFESFMIMCTRSNKMLTLHVILCIPVHISSYINTCLCDSKLVQAKGYRLLCHKEVQQVNFDAQHWL